MKLCVGLAALVLVSLSAVSAQADHRWKYRDNAQWQDPSVYWEDENDDVVYYEEDVGDEAERYYQQERRNIRPRDEAEIWWLEDGARTKLEQRSHKRKTAAAPVVKKAAAKPVKPKQKVVAEKPVKAVVKPKLQVASLSSPTPVEKPKRNTLVTPKSDRLTDKTIGCTAGAAVVTGYGFAGVKPKACTGKTYAYTAARAGKTYEIQLMASSGEIIDVKKLN